jgi:hypothetical protein
MPVLSKNAAAWSILHQILTRSDEKLIALMTYPCDEQYACLTVARENVGRLRPVISINLNGTGILAGDEVLRYQERLTTAQVRKLADDAALLAELTLNREARPLAAMEFLLKLLTTNKGISIRNAWHDGAYNSGLCEAATAFSHYPIASVQNWQEHIPWWIILYGHAPIAACKLETGQLILENGAHLTLAADNGSALETVRRIVLKQEFLGVITETRKLLAENPEWETRYKGYADEMNESYIEKVRSSFHEWAPLMLYMNVSNAKKAKQHLIFELRYLGQTVAQLRYKTALLLDTTGYDALNQRDFGCTLNAHSVPWNSPAAATFRSFFKERAAKRNADGKSNEEHRLESLLLSEFSKVKEKTLPFIQPVRVARLRFPMPTPISASQHEQVKYSGSRGGGIDLFARMGKGKGTFLAILELKDENTAKEPPKDALKQAIAYAVFIRELLRSEAGSDWWRLFGFGGSIPERLKLIAACVMPTGQYDDESFAGMELAVDEDIIRLNYIYFTEQQNAITDIRTSLDLKRHFGERADQ